MHFRTSVKLTLALLALALLFARLGWWQLERKAEKQLLFEQFVNGPRLSVALYLLSKLKYINNNFQSLFSTVFIC